jgi:hydrogenase maturation protease
MTTTLVIGVGNADRGDDAAGLEAARLLEERRAPGLEVRRFNEDGAALLEAFRGVDRVVLLDAVVGTGRPGTVVRVDPAQGLAILPTFHASSHAFGVSQAIELARALHWLPGHLVVFGIEGKSFTPGEPLSDEARGGVRLAVERVLRECLVEGASPSGRPPVPPRGRGERRRRSARVPRPAGSGRGTRSLRPH